MAVVLHGSARTTPRIRAELEAPREKAGVLPKNALALVKTGQDHEAPLRIVGTVVADNDQRKRAMARKVVAACGGSVRGKTIAILGPRLQAQHRRHARGSGGRHRHGPARRRREGT